MSEKISRRRQVHFHTKKKGFNFFCCAMDAPSPEPPAAGAALAAAPAPAGILADAVAAVANAAAAVAGDPPLASASNSSSSSTSVGDQQQSLEFDSTAACVGLGGSAWTCFKKELPDSQIATRCGGMEEEKRRGEREKRERENSGRERRASKSIAGKKTDAPSHFLVLLLPRSHPFRSSAASLRQNPHETKPSLWLWTAVGLACLLLFCALLHLIPTYRTRLFLPNLVRKFLFFFSFF